MYMRMYSSCVCSVLCCRGDPATLSYVIQAVNKYTDAKRSAHPQQRLARAHAAAKSASSTATTSSSHAHAHASTSINSVVHLLESTDLSRRVSTPTMVSTTSTSPLPLRWQCRHCSYVYEGGQHTEGSACFMCAVGTISKARAGAQTNPDVFKSAMEVANRLTRAQQAHIPHATTTSNNNTRSYVPSVWPRGRNCDACNRILAVMYCKSCTSTRMHMHTPSSNVAAHVHELLCMHMRRLMLPCLCVFVCLCV